MKELQERYPLVTGANQEILRKKAKTVDIISKDIRDFAKDLLKLMHLYDGVGIAAPQVGRSIRMSAFMQLEIEGNSMKPKMEDVMINPKIISKSDATEIEYEGCLSLPGVEGKVERPKEIVVEYMNMHDEKVIHKAKGYNARIILHEIDHLNGILFIDKQI